MIANLYRGYSTHEYNTNKTFSINDIEVVKLDIMSHLFTRKGERVMMPNFGTRIPDMAFEPLDEFTLAVIDEDIRNVVAFDPRVQLTELVIEPLYDANTVNVSVRLLYVELNLYGNIDLNIATAAS